MHDGRVAGRGRRRAASRREAPEKLIEGGDRIALVALPFFAGRSRWAFSPSRCSGRNRTLRITPHRRRSGSRRAPSGRPGRRTATRCWSPGS